MKFLKPPWVNHGGSSSRNVSCNPIFAIDFHPKGKKFATGGQGEDSGRVAIWNVLPVFSAKIENDENVPKLLCQMDNHLANVNCVRWSYSGEFLASAGDDKLVMIWQLSQYGGGSIFGSSQVAAESWRCVATLNAHEGDILDLSWSPNDSKLASASVDNDIIIWNMRASKPERLKTLKGHTGFVKGVSFDPIGKFLASQADDKTLRIWRTSDWKEEKVVKTPFEECSGTTPVLRLDWSPEGQFLISAHAMNGGGPTAQIVDRDGWKTDRDVVGHRKAVTCVRFSRCLYRRKMKGKDKTTVSNVCAVGSRDHSISIWQSVFKRPLVVIHDLFKEPVLDLSWDNSGKRLLACSWDGTVACIEFKKEELGEILAKEDRDAYFKRLYGTSYANDQPVRVIRENPIVEPLPDLPLHDRTTSTAPVLRASGQTLRDDGQDWSNQSALATKNVRPATPTAKQVETRLADGRRRITPMFLPPPTSAMSEIPIAPSVNGQTIFSSSAEPSSRIQIERQEKQPSTASHPLEEDRGEKRPLDGLPDSFVVKKPRLLSVPPTPQKAEWGLAVRFEGGSGTRIRLPALQPRKTYTVSIDFAGRALTVESVNDAMASGRDNLHRLTGFSTGSKVWEQVFSSKIVALEASNRIVCAATQDGNLHMFTPEGNRRFPPIVTSGVSSLNLLHHFVFLLATDGRVNVWDVKVGRATCRNVSVEDLCGHGANAQISCCKITENGMPVVSVSNGKSFAYCSNLESWMELASSEDPVSRSSDIQASDILAKESKEFSLSSLARSSSGQRPRPAVRCSAEVQSVCTQSYLEQQMCASLSVESSSEYRAWLHALVRHLSSVAAEQQLRSICKDLLGPLYQSPSWKPDVLGISKHGLLKEVLQIISQQVRLQRLYCEFAEQLKMNTSLTQI